MVTNRDASLTTARRRQLALYSWRKDGQYPQNPQTNKTEQRPSYGSRQTGPTGDVPVQAYVGAQLVGQAYATGEAVATCGCPSGVSLAGYSKNGIGK
jgi:hypothetical protein